LVLDAPLDEPITDVEEAPKVVKRKSQRTSDEHKKTTIWPELNNKVASH
jgi:hypothetical protein